MLLARAIAAAIEQVPGADALADIRLEMQSALLFVWNRSCVWVRGDAVRLGEAEADEAGNDRVSVPRRGTP